MTGMNQHQSQASPTFYNFLQSLMTPPTVNEITIIPTLDKVEITLHFNANRFEVFEVPHNELEMWAGKNEKLIVDNTTSTCDHNGEYQECGALEQISYTEFIMHHFTNEDAIQYLTDHKLISNGYKFTKDCF